LIRTVADRQAVTFGDVAKAAIPARAVRADKNWVKSQEESNASDHEPVLEARLCEPRVISRDFGQVKLHSNAWVIDALDSALTAIADGGSAIVCCPDFRDTELIFDAAKQLGIETLITRYGSELSRTERYLSHLNSLDSRPQIVVGTRSALFAPLQNLLHIVVWDDEDPSHYDQASPYVSSREVALIRQKIENSSLSFLSHSRSAAIQRLVEIGYLREASESFAKPAVAFSERDVRVDSLGFNTVRTGLATGPVLVQVSNLGVAKSAYCKGCATRATCQHCAGPLWIDTKGDTRCRWCNGFNLAFKCNTCGGNTLRMGRAGSTRTASELGRAFPGVPVVEANGNIVVTRVSSKPQIVVSTPGAEPQADGGYAAIVILDCDVALARDTLHAREDALRVWANAVSLGSPTAKSALIGLASDLGTLVANWRMVDFAKEELNQRAKLGFPPVQRMLSATGSKDKVVELVDTLTQIENVSKLGLAPIEGEEWRALIKFSYAAGTKVADAVRVFQLKNSGMRRLNQKSGQHQRAVSIKIDDPRVL